MRRLGLERELVDPAVYERTVGRFREQGIVLPTFAQLADPTTIPAPIADRLAATRPGRAASRSTCSASTGSTAPTAASRTTVPEHVVLPTALTGVEARIVVALGDRFPMIDAHKVLAAYGCLAPRIVTGQFDPTAHGPSGPRPATTAAAASRSRGSWAAAAWRSCPTGMSRERFDWLERWVADPADIIRTPGTESNVKEIYDRCAELDREPDNVIFNQFCEFGNHLAHYALHRPRARARASRRCAAAEPDLRAGARSCRRPARPARSAPATTSRSGSGR